MFSRKSTINTTGPCAGFATLSATTVELTLSDGFTGVTVPDDGTQYLFSTTATSTLPGIGVVSNPSSSTVTKTQSCSSGSF